MLDFSRVLAGPWCTQLLGDAGADVLKLEPLGGDVTRSWGPPFVPVGGGKTMSTYFICCNRNKRSLALDLRAPQGAAVGRALAARADVIVANDRPGSLAALGLGADELCAANPRLIYASITGWGTTGPRAAEPAYDLGISAVSGLMSITGPEGGPPAKPGVALTDIATGLYLHGAILTALLARSSSGLGARLDTSLLETGIFNLANAGTSALHGGSPRARGSAHESIVPYQAFTGACGTYFIVAATSDTQWQALCARIGAAALAADSRLASNAGRVAHRSDVIGGLQAIFAKHDRAHWLRTLAGVVTATPVLSVSEALADSQVVSLGLVRELVVAPARAAVATSGSGTCLRALAHPVQYSGGGLSQPGDAARAPPLLGEHTREALAEAGLAPAEIEALIAADVARVADAPT